MRKLLYALLLCALLPACQSRQVGAPAPGVKVGKPYTVSGRTYYPAHDPGYSEEGIASWYGPGFHGKSTANGEIFDEDDLTAAHPTLPMPSLVRVTNLKNGKSMMVRVNDRGPFKPGRIIDLSRGSAEALDIKGIEKVRVEYLPEETERYWASRNISPGTQIAGGPVWDNSYIAPQNQQIAAAAPIMSVSSDTLEPMGAPRRGGPSIGFISEAYAEERRPPLPAPLPANSDAIYRPPDKSVALAPQMQPATGPPGGNDPPPPSSPRPAALYGSPPVIRGGYYIQAGAFASEQNASALSRRLDHLGQVRLVSMLKDRLTLHRVWLGPFDSEEKAVSLLESVSTLGIRDAKIVRE